MRKRISVILVLLCVCSVYLFSNYVLTPASESDRESLAKKYKTLQYYEKAVKGAATTEEKIRALNSDVQALEKRLITEKSDFLAAAKIQREITDLAGKTNLSISTIRPLAAVKLNEYNVTPTEKSDSLAAAKIQKGISDHTGRINQGIATARSLVDLNLNEYNAVPVYFEGGGNIKQLSNFLKMLESDELLLRIDKLSINVTNMQKTDDLKFKIQIAGIRKI